MCAQVRKALRRLRSESGQSLVVVTVSMLVVMGMAAFGIDVATWYQKHHEAQVVADAAALAAANCLAHPNTGPTGYTCSSATDVAGAQAVAVYYAAQNGVTITAGQVNVDTANGKVTVNANATAPTFFARLFGIGNTQPHANSSAGYKSKQVPCTTAGQNCDFMFANSNNCSTGSYVLITSTQGSSAINGNIQSNGSLDASQTGNGGGINGSGTYGPGSCTSVYGTNNGNGSNNNPWNNGNPTQASSLMTWPVDYSQDFPACGGGSPELPCSTSSAANGYPSFCTDGGANWSFDSKTLADQPKSGHIYCASGTSTTPSNPSTWNGSITLNASGNNTWTNVSFIGGTINYSGNGGDSFSPCGYTASGFSSAACPSAPAPATANYPIFYAIDADTNSTACGAGTNVSTNCAFSMSSGGNLTLSGDVSVQQGTAYISMTGNQSAGTTTSSTMIEANVINASLKGNFNGDGPALDSGGTINGGYDYLSQ